MPSSEEKICYMSKEPQSSSVLVSFLVDWNDKERQTFWKREIEQYVQFTVSVIHTEKEYAKC